MGRLNWILAVLAAAAAGAGFAESGGWLHTPVPFAAFYTIAGVLALLLVLRLLPLAVRRPVVFLLTLVLLVAVSGGLYYFQFVIKPNMVKGFLAAAFAPKPTAVSVENVMAEKWAPTLPVIGTLKAYQGIDIAPQVAGLVKAIHFKSGDEVKAGAPLIDLDDSVEQADLANADAQLKNAQITLERQQTLVVGGNTAKAQVDSAMATRDSAQASVEHTQAIIAQKAIKAPFPGRLGISKTDLGQYVAVGASLVTLQQLDPIYADFQTPEQSLNSLTIGQKATMTLDAFPGRTFEGVIRAIDARVSSDSRNALVRAEFPNPDEKLLPGMYANISVTTGAPVDVLTLPRTAIVYSLYGDTVFVVKPAPPPTPAPGAAQAATPTAEGGLIVERRFVRVGDVRGERVAVTEGVSAGERIVTTGQVKLFPNSPVTIDANGNMPPPAQTPKL